MQACPGVAVGARLHETARLHVYFRVHRYARDRVERMQSKLERRHDAVLRFPLLEALSAKISIYDKCDSTEREPFHAALRWILTP